MYYRVEKAKMCACACVCTWLDVQEGKIDKGRSGISC